MTNKIFELHDLSSVIVSLKNQGKKIVHCHGVFDLVHPGHIKHLEAAKKFGDILVVTITEDKFVNKGPGRPIFTEIIRAENLAALEIIDFVAINHSPLAIPAIEAIKPDFYVKGQEYKNAAEDITGGIIAEKKKVEEFNGKLVFTEEIVFSSTKLLNQHLDFSNTEVKEYLKEIRQLTSFEKLKNDFDKISKLKVLVFGDIILDEYTFVVSQGKASKSATITAKRGESEIYAGGVLAVTNHIAGFVKEVKLVTTYGLNFGTNYLEFIKSKLQPNIILKEIFTPDHPTVLKRRFVDRIFKHKLFEIIEIEDTPLPTEIREKILAQLKEAEKNYDLIVVSDFGHGLIDSEIVSYLSKLKCYLAINAQTNSSNFGFNLLNKYSRCDYFSIDENECRLASHNKYENIDVLLPTLMNQMHATNASITLGVRGAMVGRVNPTKQVVAPVLSNEIVDTIGAGDAFLSITSLLSKNGNSIEEIALVGNAVGAMAVKILGNKSFIEKVPLLKYIKTLLT